MNTTVRRRSINQVVKKAPQQLWDKHRLNYERNATSSVASKLADKTAAEFSKAEQAKSFSTSKYSIFPIQTSGNVLPLFAPNNNNSSSSSIFSFDYHATGFIWNLYKPPYALTMKSSLKQKNSSDRSTSDASSSPPSIDDYVEETFTKAEKELMGMMMTMKNQQSKCPFQQAAMIEMNKIRQAMEWNPQKNNRFVNFQEGGKKKNLDDEDEFLRTKQNELSRAEVLSGLGMNQERESLRRKNLLKAASAAELPHSMAFAWASMQKWNFECATILARDISGVVPIIVREEDDATIATTFGSNNSSSALDLLPSFGQTMIRSATFEAVIEGHIPRSLPSTRLEHLLASSSSSSNSNDRGGNGIFSQMMYNPNKDVFTVTNSGSRNGNVLEKTSPTTEAERLQQEALQDVEASQVSVVRHGYYLQEPVTVVRWKLSGRNCAQVSPDEVLKKLFYSYEHHDRDDQQHQHSNDSSSSSASTTRAKKNKGSSSDKNNNNVYYNNTNFVVGHPKSRMTQRYDIPIPMCCLRGVEIADDPSAAASQSPTSGRRFALPRSPYASEEMIASAPNSSRFADAVRKASLMDGYFTP